MSNEASGMRCSSGCAYDANQVSVKPDFKEVVE
jgi:hypothetical protein